MEEDSFSIANLSDSEETAVKAAQFPQDDSIRDDGTNISQDSHGLFFYDMSRESSHSDITRFLLDQNVVVNEEPPRHAPLTKLKGRFLYVVAVKSKADIKSAKCDFSGSWNFRRKGEKACVEKSEQWHVQVKENRYVKCEDSEVFLRVYRAVKPNLSRLRRTITIDMDARNEPKGRMCIEYIYQEEGDFLEIVNDKRVDEREKRQIKDELLTQSTRMISANHPQVSSQQITNIARSVPERPKINVGPVKEVNWNDLKKRLSQGNFLKKEILKTDMEMYICYDEDLFRMFLKSVPSRDDLMESRDRDVNLLHLDQDKRRTEISSQFRARGSRSGLCTLDITFARGGYYCGKLYSYNRNFLTKSDRQVSHQPVAFFFAKRHSKKELKEFGAALSEAANDLGYGNSRVRSICRDGEEGLDAILESKLFEESTVVRCEVHIRKNCTDALGDVNGNNVATRLLGNCGKGVRREGLVDCCSIGSAKRALEEWRGTIPDTWVTWLESHLDSIYSSNGIKNRLIAGYGYLTISNNPLESTNSWDSNRLRKNLSLDQYLSIMEESCQMSVQHCAQAPFGGGNLIVSDVPLVYRSIWETYSEASKEGVLFRYGIMTKKKKGFPSVKLPEILSSGRTKLDFDKVLRNTSNLEPAESSQFDGYISFNRDTDKMIVLRRIDDVLTCRSRSCDRSSSHTVCVHLLSIFLHDEFGKKEANKFAEYLINLESSRFKKAISTSVDGLKTKYRRYGNAESERSKTKVVIGSVPFDTESFPIVQQCASNGLRATSSNLADIPSDDWNLQSISDPIELEEEYMCHSDAMNGTDLSLDLTIDREQAVASSMMEEMAIAGRMYNERKRVQDDAEFDKWKKKIEGDTEMESTEKRVNLDLKVPPLPVMRLRRIKSHVKNEAPAASEMYLSPKVVVRNRVDDARDSQLQSIYNSHIPSTSNDASNSVLHDFLSPRVLPPHSKLYHNLHPFVVGSITEKVPADVISRRTCVSCGGTLPEGRQLVIFHMEKVRNTFGGKELIRTMIGVIHSSLKCLRSRYPYAHSALLYSSKQLSEGPSEEEVRFVREEFGCHLNSLSISINFT